MVHEGDAAHLHVTTKTQINLHNRAGCWGFMN